MAYVINISISKEDCFAERHEKSLLPVILGGIIATDSSKEIIVNVNISD